MTTLVLNYSTSLLEGFVKGFKNTLKGFMVGWMIARQAQANRYVAEQISRYEYNGQDYYIILDKLNRRTVKQIHEEFGYDEK